MTTKRILYVFAALMIALLGTVGCKVHEDNQQIIDGTGEIVGGVADWGRAFGDGLDGEITGQPKEPASKPAPEPKCDWSDFGPCDQPPPIEWFGITDDNGNGINDADE